MFEKEAEEYTKDEAKELVLKYTRYDRTEKELQDEIVELKAQIEKLKKQFEPQDMVQLMNEIEAPYKLQEAKEIIRDLLFHLGNTFIVSYTSKEESLAKAEQFLKEVSE